MWAQKEAAAGLVLAFLSLLVARHYLSPVTPPSRPGLRIHGAPEKSEPVPPSPASVRVGLVYLGLAAVGIGLAAHGFLRLLRGL